MSLSWDLGNLTLRMLGATQRLSEEIGTIGKGEQLLEQLATFLCLKTPRCMSLDSERPIKSLSVTDAEVETEDHLKCMLTA